jgi:RNA polymerase primary sigma factor
MENPKKHSPAREISTDEGLALYLQEIGKIPTTTREEEQELAERIQKGDQEALNRLVEGNLKFVVKVAQSYQGCGLSQMDLINEGNLGLIEAAKRFDPSKNVKFISYAVWVDPTVHFTGFIRTGSYHSVTLKAGRALSKAREGIR